MTKEERELLLKDLCARLPYGVIVETYWDFEDKKRKTFPKTPLTANMLNFYLKDEIWNISKAIHFLPYLRHISSMTEEEKVELYQKTGFTIDDFILGLSAIDWFNDHHFDYRGLIPMGLALEAPEGMYKTK